MRFISYKNFTQTLFLIGLDLKIISMQNQKNLLYKSSPTIQIQLFHSSRYQKKFHNK